MVKKGDIIVAKRTSEQWGFKKRDILRVTEEPRICVIAENLTRPGCGVYGEAVLMDHEYRYPKESDLTRKTTRSTVHFLGIPVLTIKDVKGVFNDE